MDKAPRLALDSSSPKSDQTRPLERSSVARLSASLLIAALTLSAACTQVPQPQSERPTPGIGESETQGSTTQPAPITEIPRGTLATATPEFQPSSVLPSPLPSCLQEPGQVEIGELADSALPRSLPYRIYLPPCYKETSGNSLPTLYLLHGLQRTDGQWDDLGADEIAQQLIASGEAQPYLIVMPWERKGLDFEDTIISYLIPYISSTYGASPDREHRAIGGISRGAGWALRIALKNPEQFGTVGLHSPAVLAPDLYYIPRWVEDTQEAQPPMIWIDIGERDTLRFSAMELVAFFDELGVSYRWQMYPGEHTESYWMTNMENYMRWYAAEWPGELAGSH